MSVPIENIPISPIRYSATFQHEKTDSTEPLPKLLATTVTGVPSNVIKNNIVQRVYNFQGQAWFPSHTSSLLSTKKSIYILEYDFADVFAPVLVSFSGPVSGYLTFYRDKKVLNASRYITWQRSSEQSGKLTFVFRFPACFFEDTGEEGVFVDFFVNLKDSANDICNNDVCCSNQACITTINGATTLQVIQPMASRSIYTSANCAKDQTNSFCPPLAPTGSSFEQTSTNPDTWMLSITDDSISNIYLTITYFPQTQTCPSEGATTVNFSKGCSKAFSAYADTGLFNPRTLQFTNASGSAMSSNFSSANLNCTSNCDSNNVQCVSTGTALNLLNWTTEIVSAVITITNNGTASVSWST